MGGVWERMVRSVKTTMKVIINDQAVSDYVLLTIFTEIEALVNSRPLTHVSDDINDLESLTPSHFLIGRPNKNLQPCLVYDKEVTFKQRWRQVQAITNQFWGRWIREYLPTLTTRNKWYLTTNKPAIGDLVLLIDEQPTRGKWPLARITKLKTSNDGITRSVEIRTAGGNYVRPIRKLAPLELSEH